MLRRGKKSGMLKLKRFLMTKTLRILVKSSAGKYAVVCGVGVLARISLEIAEVGEFSSVHVVTSPKVWAAVGKKVSRGMGGAKAVRVHSFDDAEAEKNLNSVERISRSLLKAGADRRSVVVAVGRWVVEMWRDLWRRVFCGELR